MLMYTFNVFESTSSQHKYYSRENCMIFYLIYMVNFIWIHSRPSFLNLQNHILVAIPWQTISLSFISFGKFLYMIFYWFSTWATMNSPDKERHSIHTFINYIDNAKYFVPVFMLCTTFIACSMYVLNGRFTHSIRMNCYYYLLFIGMDIAFFFVE